MKTQHACMHHLLFDNVVASLIEVECHRNNPQTLHPKALHCSSSRQRPMLLLCQDNMVLLEKIANLILKRSVWCIQSGYLQKTAYCPPPPVESTNGYMYFTFFTITICKLGKCMN